MSANIVQAQYEQLEQLAARFAAAAETQQALLQRVNQRVDVLRQGGWQGKGVAAFLREMDGEVAPAMGRLIEALEQAENTSIKICMLLRTAEAQAAVPFQDDQNRPNGQVSITAPPPRIYIINGINSAGNVPGLVGDGNSVNLERLIELHGYPPSEVISTPAIYLRPINFDEEKMNGTQWTGTSISGSSFTGTDLSGTNWGGWKTPFDWISQRVAMDINTATGAGAKITNAITGVGADSINSLTGTGANYVNTITDKIVETGSKGINIIYGAGEVVGERVSGNQGHYTQEIYRYIAKDLKANPLLPGQQLILIGHSGGGAVIDDLPGMLEGKTGVDVAGVVTIGSPLFDANVAGQSAKIVQIYHQNDFLGQLGRLESISGQTNNVVLEHETSDAHGTGMRSDETVDALAGEFPEMNL